MNRQNWHEAVKLLDVAEEDVTPVVVADREIALYRVRGEVYATDNLCTHGQARLCDGYLEGHEIECPLHQGRFDIRDGRPLCGPVTKPVRTYPAWIADGWVVVALD